MKKKYFLIIFVFVLPIQIWACDICGCGIGNNYIGLLPDFKAHIMGLRYRYNSSHTHLGYNGGNTYLTTKEKYTTVELWAGWNFAKKYRLSISLPYNFNQNIQAGTKNTKTGLGDISFTGFYKLLHKKHAVANNKIWINSMWLGAGIKLATGKYNQPDKVAGNNLTNLYQLGTGSTDFTIAAMYDSRLQDAGINLSANYKIGTSNKWNYTYGNKLNISGQAYYKIKLTNHISISPSIGLQYEKAWQDKDAGYLIPTSGGKLWQYTGGVEMVLGKMAIGANYQNPFAQKLAGGAIKANQRYMIHTAIAL